MKFSAVVKPANLVAALVTIMFAMPLAAQSNLVNYRVKGIEMETVAKGGSFESAGFSSRITLPATPLLELPALFRGDASATEIIVRFNGTTLDSYGMEMFEVERWNILYVDIEPFAGKTGELEFTLNSTGSTPSWVLFPSEAAPADGWISEYSGTAPPARLNLGLNNIGFFNPADGQIYSCLNVQTNNTPSTFGGMARIEVRYSVESLEQGIIRVQNSRGFNTNNAVTGTGASPSCSGVFETTTGLLTDLVQVGKDTYRVTFELINGNTLELKLKSLVVL